MSEILYYLIKLPVMKMKTTLAIILLIFSIQVSAQKTYRRANVRIELTGPPEGTTLRQGRLITYSFKVFNTSDVPILQTDTIVYRPSYSYRAEALDVEGKRSFNRVLSPGDSMEFQDTITIRVASTSLHRTEISFGVYSFVYGPATEKYTALNWEPFSEQEDNNSDLTYAFDGFLDVSEINSVRILVFPNPTRKLLYIEAKEQIESFEIWSLDGKLMKSGERIKEDRLNISELPIGIYVIKCFDKDGRVFNSKFIKT
jgi:hypothetical protein